MDESEKIPKRIAIYLRVSTADQTEKYGLDLQRDAVMAMIRSRSNSDEPFIFAGEEYEYVDDISGATPLAERPSFHKLMEDIAMAPEGSKPFDAIAVYKIDRFARKLSVLLEAIDFFEQSKIQFISVNESIDTSTPFGRAMLGIIGVIAELERDTIKDRTTAGRIAAIQKGVHMGSNAKYGYKKDENKRLELCKDEARVLEMIFDMFTSQRKSVYEIASFLSENKYLTPEASAIKHAKHKGTGKAKSSPYSWHAENIRRFISDEIYTGKAYYGKTKAGKKVPKSDWVVYPVPPIIDELTFEKAQQIAKESKHHTQRMSSKHIYLLSGLLKCDTCKGHHRKHFIGTPKTIRKSGKRVHYYVCKGKSTIYNKKTCNTLPLSADALERYVVGLCKKLLANPIHTFKYQSSLNSTKLEIKQKKQEEAQLRKLLTSLPELRERLRYQHEVGLIDNKRLERELNKTKVSEKEYLEKLDAVRAQLSKNSLDKAYIETFKLFDTKYQKMLSGIEKDREDAYSVLHSLIDEIVVYSRPVRDADKIAGKKKDGQMIANRIHIKFRLPQDILNEIGKQKGVIKEKAPLTRGASSSQKNDSGAR